MSEIYGIISTNHGASFGDTTLISEIEGDSGVSAVMPDVAIDENGIHVIWLDLRYNNKWELLYRRSTDFGDEWDDVDSLAANVEEDSTGDGSAFMWEPFIMAEGVGELIAGPAEPSVIGALLSANGGDSWSPVLIDSTGTYSRDVNCCRIGNYVGAAWCDQAWTFPSEGPRNWEVSFKRSNQWGLQWLTYRRLSWNSAYSIQPSIDSDAGLKVGVAWAERGSDSTGVFQVVFRKSTNTGLTWSYPHHIVSGRSDGAWQPDLAWDRENDIAYLVWIDYSEGHGELYYSTLEGDTWTHHGQFTDDTLGTVDVDLPDLLERSVNLAK